MSRDLSRRQFMAAPGRNGRARGLRHTLSGSCAIGFGEPGPQRQERRVGELDAVFGLQPQAAGLPHPREVRGADRLHRGVPRDIDDNVSFNGKVAQLARGMDIGYDLGPSDSLIAPGSKKGWAAPLDKANIPNSVNLLPELEDVPFRPRSRVFADLPVRVRRPCVEQGAGARRTAHHG